MFSKKAKMSKNEYSTVYIIYFMCKTDEGDWVSNYHVEFEKDEADNMFAYFKSNTEEFKNVIMKRFDESHYANYNQPMILAKECMHSIVKQNRI